MMKLDKYESLEVMYRALTPYGSGEMSQEEKDAFYEYMGQIRTQGTRLGATGLVLYVCEDMSSSSFGQSKGLFFGPTCTYKSVDDIPEGDLDVELASTRKQPRGWAEL